MDESRFIELHHRLMPPAFSKATKDVGISHAAGAPLWERTPQQFIDLRED